MPMMIAHWHPQGGTMSSQPRGNQGPQGRGPAPARSGGGTLTPASSATAASSRRHALSELSLAALVKQLSASVPGVQGGTTTSNTSPGVHAGLWLDRFLRTQAREDESARRELVAEVASIPVPSDYADAFERWVETLGSSGAALKKAVVQTRMIVGLGGESPLETHITLHRTYGVPFIPGSALKGLAAAFARQRLGAEWRQDSQAYQVLFGDTTSAGFVTFYDALPIVTGTGPEFSETHPQLAQLKKRTYGRSLLEPDILTVHHPEYYMGEGEQQTAPADWDSPTPVPFLTAVGAYLVALAGPTAWVKAAYAILEQALEEEGIGAKTSSGYGRLKVESFRGGEGQERRPVAQDTGSGLEEHDELARPTPATLTRNKGDGTLTAMLPGGKKAEARKPKADALWGALPPEVKAKIDKGKAVPVQIRYSQVGNALQIESIEVSVAPGG